MQPELMTFISWSLHFLNNYGELAGSRKGFTIKILTAKHNNLYAWTNSVFNLLL